MPVHCGEIAHPRYATPFSPAVLEHSGRADCRMAWQGFWCDRVSLCVCLSVADAPLSERVNPLILNQADVLAHHSLSSRPLLSSCLLLNLQASAKCYSISIPVCFGLLLKLALESCTPEKANTNTVDFAFLLCIYCLVKFIFCIHLPCLRIMFPVLDFIVYVPDRNLKH